MITAADLLASAVANELRSMDLFVVKYRLHRNAIRFRPFGQWEDHFEHPVVIRRMQVPRVNFFWQLAADENTPALFGRTVSPNNRLKNLSFLQKRQGMSLTHV